MSLLKKEKWNKGEWVFEVHDKNIAFGWKIKKHLYSKKSPFQQVDVVDTFSHGKVLLNDGIVMISERDEFVYHDMISHVPLFSHPLPENVLIIGGGDGGTAREVIRHKNVKKCYMVEIDRCVVEACKEHIPQTASALSDSRIHLKIDDGVKFVAETELKFDVIIIDSTDPVGPGIPLFGEEFYKNVSRVLNKKGIVVSQAESPFYSRDIQLRLYKILKGIFKNVKLYNYSNITYPGGLWSFSFASNEQDPLKDFDEKRVSESNLKFSYYTPEVHKSAFELPQFMKKDL